jgi:hypothetical protein
MQQHLINPAFHRHPEEATIVGRLLAAFGELEYMTAALAAKANGAFYPVLKSLYRLRVTSSRIDAADALMRPEFAKLGIDGEYGQMIGALRFALRIRNQYAHCNWADDLKAGYFSAIWRSPLKPLRISNTIGIISTPVYYTFRKRISYIRKTGCFSWRARLISDAES